jgi:hypothetical protein
MPALDELGWLQFERLCELVLEADAGVDPAVWEGSADGQRRTVWDAKLPLGERTLEPPVLIRCEWVRDGDTARLEALADPEKLCLWQPARPRSVVTFVNRGPVGPLPVDHVVYGESELLEAVRRLPDLCLRLPSVLALETLAPDPDAVARSTADIEAMRALARVFVPTPAWRQAVSVLQDHHFLVLTGPPEMGKTAIARMLGLALLTQGWEVHECTKPSQVFERLDPSRPQLFIADDAFGSTEYRPDAAERWAAELDGILRSTDETHWLVWTSRPAPLRAGLRRLHRERGAERFPQPGAVQVDASALGPEEKTLILYRHARAAALSERARRVLREQGRSIVEHEHFTPERIRRFIARGAPAGEVERELTEPTEAMQTSLAALPPELRELLIAMLDTPPGPTAERDLTDALRRHCSNGLPKAPADLVDRLTDHFLRVLR